MCGFDESVLAVASLNAPVSGCRRYVEVPATAHHQQVVLKVAQTVPLRHLQLI